MAAAPKNTYVVLLAGGTGTRLWPSSRKKNPKQFARLFAQHTLFQETVKRVKGLVPLSHIFVITNKAHADEIKKEEPLLPEENIIEEPEKKNTALAMAVASAYVYKKDPNAVVINLATDQVISKMDIFQDTMAAAARFVSKHQCLATTGIVPTFPHTGLEYIKQSEKFDEIDGQTVYKIDGFIKRPEITDTDNPIPRAQEYLDSGDYLWNANMYVWPAKVILDEFKELAPDIYENTMAIYQAIGTDKEKEVLIEEYHKAREDQIDFAIATKSKRLYVLRGAFDWNDIGSWKVVHDLSAKDKDNNSIIVHNGKGQHVGIDTTNSLIQTEDQLIVTIGIDNLVIVDTKDALLVCRKDRAEELKKVIEMLKEKKLEEYL